LHKFQNSNPKLQINLKSQKLKFETAPKSQVKAPQLLSNFMKSDAIFKKNFTAEHAEIAEII